MTTKIQQGDCVELLKNLPDKSVDLLICDLPYGETNCKWDSIIDMEEFWKQFKRIRKHKRVACIHFCSTKFGYSLIKSWEKGFKMDMCWKKRNKTGGLQSRHRPMRNHEMIYFFYEQAPKYNRDKYHKRIRPVKNHNINDECVFGSTSNIDNIKLNYFDPPNPASILEDKVYNENPLTDKKLVNFKQANFEPVQPASVVETITECKTYGTGKYYGYANGEPAGAKWSPVLPTSVMEDTVWFCSDVPDAEQPVHNLYAIDINNFSLPDENEPLSIYESKKVFIGKRNHQTEKPQDILEFFLRYWSDEGDTILDPTMGSGSTGVACKKLKRNFIGFELDETIFKTAEERISNS